MDRREQLTTIVRAQACDMEAWEAAELHLLDQAFRQRLEALGIEPTTDVGVALMAAAILLGPHTPEWGGDCRATLCEIARLGLGLLDETP